MRISKKAVVKGIGLFLEFVGPIIAEIIFEGDTREMIEEMVDEKVAAIEDKLKKKG